MKSIQYMGLDCVELNNGHLSLVVTVSAGPRVLALRIPGGENLFAELPDVTTETPTSGTYHFYGGHRLWMAPEDLDRTYMPDNTPVQVSEDADGVLFTQAADPVFGLEKSLRIRLAPDAAQVTVVHSLQNRGEWPQTGSLWAITQMRPGGLGVLPQSLAQTGLLPNRALTLWPYTDMRSPHIQWGNEYIFVTANVTEGALKIGFPNPRGWLGYALDGTLFVKRTQYDPTAIYYDGGSSSECYCNARFLELETLGAMVALVPGDVATHHETWEVFADVDVQPDEAAMHTLAAELGLDESAAPEA